MFVSRNSLLRANSTAVPSKTGQKVYCMLWGSENRTLAKKSSGLNPSPCTIGTHSLIRVQNKLIFFLSRQELEIQGQGSRSGIADEVRNRERVFFLSLEATRNPFGSSEGKIDE